MSDNHGDLVTQFTDVTGSDEQRARFFLESSAWEIDLAIHRFFANEGGEESELPVPPGPLVAQEPVISLSDSDPELLNDDDDDDDVEDLPTRVQKKDKSKKNTNTRFATLASLQQDSSSDEEEGQAFYAGGSERSGQQIIGPGKNQDIVGNMFKSVRKHGQMVETHGGGNPSSSTSFGGTGYRLGATPDDTTVVNSRRPARRGESEVENVVLRLWRNGFSLDDGDLRPYTDPTNADFLDCVKRGEIPRELRKGPEVHLTMEDHRHEEFSKTSRGPAKPFHGKGHLLGSPAPTTIGSTSPQGASPLDQQANQNTAQAGLNINESEPITNIQFRLADGSRITGRFNLSHTVANLREYVITAAPAYQLQTFILQTTFPNKELTQMDQTIKDAGLQNALVVQRLK